MKLCVGRDWASSDCPCLIPSPPTPFERVTTGWSRAKPTRLVNVSPEPGGSRRGSRASTSDRSTSTGRCRTRPCASDDFPRRGRTLGLPPTPTCRALRARAIEPAPSAGHDVGHQAIVERARETMTAFVKTARVPSRYAFGAFGMHTHHLAPRNLLRGCVRLVVWLCRTLRLMVTNGADGRRTGATIRLERLHPDVCQVSGVTEAGSAPTPPRPCRTVCDRVPADLRNSATPRTRLDLGSRCVPAPKLVEAAG